MPQVLLIRQRMLPGRSSQTCSRFDASGAVDTETAFAKILVALDTTKEIAAIDARSTRLRLHLVLESSGTAAAEEKHGLLQQLTDLGTLKALVIPFVSIVK